jgi:hypothetical protein
MKVTADASDNWRVYLPIGLLSDVSVEPRPADHG